MWRHNVFTQTANDHSDVDAHLRTYRAGKLTTAAMNSDFESISDLLATKADPNEMDADRRLPLNTAAYTGVTRVVRELLQARADANVPARDAQGCQSRPLQIAAWQGHDEVTKLLLRSSADVNAAGTEMQSPLNSAAIQGHTATLQILVRKRADLRKESSRMTPLEAAAKGGHVEVAHVLKAALANSPAPQTTVGQSEKHWRSPLFPFMAPTRSWCVKR